METTHATISIGIRGTGIIFLSLARQEQVQRLIVVDRLPLEPTHVFEKHSGTSCHLISMFPPQSRRPKLSQYPKFLQDHLKKMGADPELKPKTEQTPATTDRIIGIVFILAFVVFLCFSFLGLCTAIWLLIGFVNG